MRVAIANDPNARSMPTRYHGTGQQSQPLDYQCNRHFNRLPETRFRWFEFVNRGKNHHRAGQSFSQQGFSCAAGDRRLCLITGMPKETWMIACGLTIALLVGLLGYASWEKKREAEQL